MKLIDLLEVIWDREDVNIYNMCDCCIAVYDGKNSIPNVLNNYNVIRIYTSENLIAKVLKRPCINIIIDTELKYNEIDKIYD